MQYPTGHPDSSNLVQDKRGELRSLEQSEFIVRLSPDLAVVLMSAALGGLPLSVLDVSNYKHLTCRPIMYRRFRRGFGVSEILITAVTMYREALVRRANHVEEAHRTWSVYMQAVALV